MKKILFATGFSLMLSFISVAALAQTEEGTTAISTPKWVSDNGYWIVETNIHTPKINTIYFYNNDNVLVYKEQLNGVVIKLKKRSVKMNLKKVLDQSVTAYNKRQTAGENEMLVMNLLKKQ